MMRIAALWQTYPTTPVTAATTAALNPPRTRMSPRLWKESLSDRVIYASFTEDPAQVTHDQFVAELRQRYMPEPSDSSGSEEDTRNAPIWNVERKSDPATALNLQQYTIDSFVLAQPLQRQSMSRPFFNMNPESDCFPYLTTEVSHTTHTSYSLYLAFYHELALRITKATVFGTSDPGLPHVGHQTRKCQRPIRRRPYKMHGKHQGSSR